MPEKIYCMNKIKIIKQKCFKSIILLLFVFFTSQKYNLFLINSVIAILWQHCIKYFTNIKKNIYILKPMVHIISNFIYFTNKKLLHTSEENIWLNNQYIISFHKMYFLNYINLKFFVKI